MDEYRLRTAGERQSYCEGYRNGMETVRKELERFFAREVGKLRERNEAAWGSFLEVSPLAAPPAADGEVLCLECGAALVRGPVHRVSGATVRALHCPQCQPQGQYFFGGTREGGKYPKS